MKWNWLAVVVAQDPGETPDVLFFVPHLGELNLGDKALFAVRIGFIESMGTNLHRAVAGDGVDLEAPGF